jgi:hypothetical protein
VKTNKKKKPLHQAKIKRKARKRRRNTSRLNTIPNAIRLLSAANTAVTLVAGIGNRMLVRNGPVRWLRNLANL